jgi:Family of unknown function (DUF5675)
MILTLQRRPQDPNSTPGQLGVNGVAECLTLEPLPTGPYPRIAAGGPWPVTLRPSPKFQQLALTDSWFKLYCDRMPHIEYKPGSVTMIHPGNTPGQTEDCVLVGQTRAPDYVGNSRFAFASLYLKILAAVMTEDGCTIEIVDCPNNAEDVQEASAP